MNMFSSLSTTLPFSLSLSLSFPLSPFLSLYLYLSPLSLSLSGNPSISLLSLFLPSLSLTVATVPGTLVNYYRANYPPIGPATNDFDYQFYFVFLRESLVDDVLNVSVCIYMCIVMSR